ncbi:MAG TPA: divergent PAP2 family protein [Candidatus Micrarchaeia archaeon]|nr:divergent PAP2 family protein [Candidatus Micrarchaeia archaeon]
MIALLHNGFIWSPLLAWAVGQVLKVVTESVRMHQLSLRPLGSSGGMPSSHTAMTVCLTTRLARLLGTASPVFATAAVLTIVVVYDATGVRRAAGQQALVLNRVLDDLRQHMGLRHERVLELLGHTPVEVLAGIALGVAIGMLV